MLRHPEPAVGYPALLPRLWQVPIILAGSLGQERASDFRMVSLLSTNADEEPKAYAERLLMSSCEAVVVSRLEKPAEVMFTVRPEHEIPSYFSGERVGPSPILIEVNPLRANAEHKFCFPRQGPGLFEEQVRIPLFRIMGIERRNAEFKFQPVLDWLDLRCKIRSPRGCASSGIPACRAADLQDRFVLFIVIRSFGTGGRRLRRSLPIGRPLDENGEACDKQPERTSRHRYLQEMSFYIFRAAKMRGANELRGDLWARRSKYRPA